MSSLAIKIENLDVTLRGHFPVLTGVTINLEKGKIIGLIGPSGAGKTTLMRVLVGRQRVTSGRVTVLDLDAGSAGLRSQISYMTQAASVYPDLTVRQNLQYFAAMQGMRGSECAERVLDIARTVDMTAQLGQLASKLSGGQKQRVSLAIALIGKPKLMVLDEPTVGLDPVLRQELWSLFRHLSSGGATLIISSHVMDEAEHCDDLVLIREGRVLAHAAPAELRRQTHTESVEHSYLRLVKAAA
jgi:ABC-2 type transport system ATP-binding protein